MNYKELKAYFDGLMKEGRSEEEILTSLYMMYSDGKITTDELRDFIGVLGYEFSDEFEALSEKDKKNPRNAFKDTASPKEKKKRGLCGRWKNR